MADLDLALHLAQRMNELTHLHASDLGHLPWDQLTEDRRDAIVMAWHAALECGLITTPDEDLAALRSRLHALAARSIAGSPPRSKERALADAVLRMVTE